MGEVDRVCVCCFPFLNEYLAVKWSGMSEALFGCTAPISLGAHFWCENSLPSILEWSFCMGQQNGPSATEQGLSE